AGARQDGACLVEKQTARVRELDPPADPAKQRDCMARSSSAAVAALTADWVRLRASAARVTCSRSATASKIRSCSSVISPFLEGTHCVSGISRTVYGAYVSMRHGLIGSVIDCIDHFILNYSLERFIDPGHITREPDIEGKTKMNKIKIAVAVATLLDSPVLAQSSRPVPAAISDVNGLSPPGVDHIGVRANALHWGMTAAEATRITMSASWTSQPSRFPPRSPSSTI